MGSACGSFWCRIRRFSWFGHQPWFDLAPTDVCAPATGHLLAVFSDMSFSTGWMVLPGRDKNPFDVLDGTHKMDLSALTIQQLRYVVAVEQHRSFRNAALASHVSQPALSMQIKRLEEILDVRIFDRSKQPVATTDEGAAIVVQARLALEHFDRIGERAKGKGDRAGEVSGSIRLGIIPTLVPSLVPILLPLLARTHPRLDVELVETRTARLTRSLREGTLDADIAATPLEIAGLHKRVLCHEAFYAYLPEGHALLSQA